MQLQAKYNFIWILILLPLLSLFLNVISLLIYGIDLPYLDDWREYIHGTIGSYHFKVLFTPSNDTLYPFGKLLDSLAYHVLHGNSIVYQFISMITVLGLLLYFQWRLLMLALNDKVLAACAFSFTLLMLQPDSYWGLQNIAYHQAIPLICILALLDIILYKNWKPVLRVPVLLLLGLISGFTYISGAFSILVLSVVLLTLGLLMHIVERKSLIFDGMVLLVPGITSVLAQLWVIIFYQHGMHRHDVPMAWPIDSDFWFYMLGKIGRSLLLPMVHSTFSLIVTLSAVLAVIAAYFYCFSCLLNKKLRVLIDFRLPIIYISLVSIVFVYLLLVAAGRANLRPIEMINAKEIFILGFYRFHYFWVTLLWPWLVAVVIMILIKINKFHILYRYHVFIFLSLIAMSYFIYSGGIRHAYYYKHIMRIRESGYQCILLKLQKNEDIYCPGLSNHSLTDSYILAKNKRVTFVRGIPWSPASK